MATGMVGREDCLEEIRKYAESDNVGNQAFLGVKGVGKTTLFQTYFTRKKRGEIAQQYHKLFVFSQLDSRKQGTDLYQFLLDQVKMGIMVIPDAEIKKEIADKKAGILEKLEKKGIEYALGEDYNTVMSGFEILIKAEDFTATCKSLGKGAIAIVGEEYEAADTKLVENAELFYSSLFSIEIAAGFV